MKLIACSVAASLFCMASTQAEIRRMVCLLTGSQEVPPVGTSARGCGLFEIDTSTNTVNYRIVYTGLSAAETAAHIHGFSAPGANSGVKTNLPAGPVKVGVWTYPEADEASLLAGLAYVNIHSGAFPGGELRGQIVDMVSFIDAAQEVPANGSTAQGVGLFMIDKATDALRYYILVGGLSSAELFSHIHGAATYGTNSGVVHNLPNGAIKTGVWNYPQAAEQSILDGLFYVNVHSANFPGGEVRGQIVSSVNPIDRLQEVPPTNGQSVGCAFCSINRNTNTLGYDIQATFVGSTETAAHIHGFAPAGINAGVLHNLGLGGRKLGTWSYPNEAAEDGILKERTYVNLHTNLFPGGEIRGQIRWPIPPCPADFDGDGFVDFFDLDAFVACFEGDPCPPGKSADFDGDGFVDFFDFDAFVAAFEQGC